MTKSLGTIVDIRGDTTWSPMADAIQDMLINPFVKIDWLEFDLSMFGRDRTDDQVMTDIVDALNTYKTGVKGPTITPTPEEAGQYGLKRAYRSPNGIIRDGIDGVAITREPIQVKGVTRLPDGVEMARLAVGDIYGAANFRADGPGTLRMVFTDANGQEQVLSESKIDGAAVGIVEVNEERTMERYARYVFNHALERGKKNVILGHKKTISKIHDGKLVEIFDRVFEQEGFREKFAAKGMAYWNLLIDTMAEMEVTEKLKPDTLIVLKNYDGDVQSDSMGGLAGSLALMTSVLENDTGVLMADPPHGTANVFNKIWEEQGILMASPVAYIFAYARAIEHRAKAVGDTRAERFAHVLRAATVQTMEEGLQAGMTTADVKLLSKYKDLETINAQDLMTLIAAKIPAGFRLTASPAQRPQVR